MGLETILLIAAVSTASFAAAGGFSSSSKPKLPSVKSVKGLAAKKSKSEKTRAESFLRRRNRRAGSRAASQVTMPGFLSPAQISTPTLSDVLG